MEIIEMTGGSPVVARVSYDLYSSEYKRGMALEWASSGSSQKGFAREKGIPDTTFSGWVKKWRAEGCPRLTFPSSMLPTVLKRLLSGAAS